MGDVQATISNLASGLSAWRKRALSSQDNLDVILLLTNDALDKCDKDSEVAVIVRHIQDLAAGKRRSK